MQTEVATVLFVERQKVHSLLLMMLLVEPAPKIDCSRAVGPAVELRKIYLLAEAADEERSVAPQSGCSVVSRSDLRSTD